MAKGEKMTEKASEAVKKAGKSLKQATTKAAGNAAALNNKVIDHAEENTRAAFAAMRSAASVKSVKDLAKVQSDYVKEQGAHVLRGGAFKPSTSPYSFHGMGEAGLKLLTEARDMTGLPIITGLERAAFLADPASAAKTIASALEALTTWTAETDRPTIGEIHVDLHGALTLHTYESATAIQLGSIDAGLAARMRTFDVAWAQLDPLERARARAIHLDPRLDHVTVAFSPAGDPQQKDQ